MSSLFRSLLCLTLCSVLSSCTAAELPKTRVLRVCADPNNLPFSNDKLQGFENTLATMLADHVNATLEYTWWAQRRGFIRNTLLACSCDVIMGLPSSMEMVRTTTPYYKSTYVFVTKSRSNIQLASLDDASLRELRIGVHIIGDDQTNAPPAHALARRGIIQNVRGFSVYGDYSKPNPPARIIDALFADELDVAIVWGPLGGYFASHASEPLSITSVAPAIDLPYLPFVFEISMAHRRDDYQLGSELESFIEHNQAQIDSLLDAYHVPRVEHGMLRKVVGR